MAQPDLVVVGHATIDDVVVRDRGVAFATLGGAAIYAAAAAALWGLRVGLVTVVGDDYPQPYLEALAGAGIDLAGVRRVPGPSAHNWILYDDEDHRTIVWQGDRPRIRRLALTPSLRDVPDAYHRPGAVHLAPMTPHRQAAFARHWPAYETRLGVDSNIKQLLTPEHQRRMLDTFRLADIIFPSEDEARVLVGPLPAEESVARLALLTDGIVALKLGRRGSLVRTPAGASHALGIVPTHAVDVTGAGDSFCGGFLAGLLLTGSAQQAQAFGTASASVMVEGYGAEHALALSSQERAAARRDALLTPIPNRDVVAGGLSR